jgi:hypothetical protein
MSYKITKEFSASHPNNPYEYDIKVIIECFLSSVTNRFSIEVNIFDSTSKQHISRECNVRTKEYIKKYFPELLYIYKWVAWNKKGPTHYNFVKDTLREANYQELEPNKYKQFLKIGSTPLLYPLESNFIKYLSINGFEKLKHTEVKLLINRDNDSIRSLYSIGDYTYDWYKAPFITRVEAQAFLDTINTCTSKIEVVSAIAEYGRRKEPNLEKAKRLALLTRVKDTSFTEKNLKRRLNKLIKMFKADLLSLGIQL